MLKALELAGFKSFAERTRFDFPAGITVVVGPNGSGKSNVIDAIKWVLGEQSVKSLRGKEMVDVIFNGSEARPALNAAETTLTFDNSSGFLPIDSPEVHVGRRVYRNGESEYLINRQVCRLRDIRDLLAGTGIGSHSYSIIEQGKVDMMLQASPQQRRVIFEEAAGISRYKVKKVEAQRRIERVDQNLLRLSDIVQEVETRLRGVKLQAHKAQQYREYSQRLKELRTQVSLVDWRKLSSSHDTAVSQLQGLQDERDTEISRAEQLESRATDLDVEIGQFEEELRAGDVRTSQNRERIAGLQSTIAHHLADEQEIHREIDRLMRQQVTMSTRSEDIQQQADEARLGLLTAEKQLNVLQSNLTESIARSTEATRLANQEKSEHAQLQEEHFSCEKEMASLASQLESLRKQLNFTKKQILEKVARTEAISKEVVEHDESVHKLQQEYDSISRRLETESAELIAATNSREDRQRQLERVSRNIAELSQRHGIAAERANVLQELEQRQEGLGAGVRELLQKSRIESDGPLGKIVGLVADLIKVNIESAPAIEAALREKAEYLVVQDIRDIQSIVTDDTYSLHGRVGFLWPIESQKEPQSQVDYSTQIGVLGRADGFVDTAPEHKQLANHLLGMTWVVESIEVAFSLLSNNDPKVSFVTLAGECLSADGTLVAGPKQGVAGLISRRSELQALKHQLASLAETLQKDETEQNQIKEFVATEDFRCKELEQQKQQTIELQQRIKIQRATTLDRQSQLRKVLQGLEQELHELKQAEENQASFLHQCQTNRQSISDCLGKLEVDLAAGSSRLAKQEEEDRRLAKEVTDAQVLLARYEQKLESLQARLRQCERDQRERNDSLSESLHRLQDTNERLRESHLTVLNTESELSHLYLRKEALRRENLHFSQARSRLTLERTAVDEELRKSRHSVRALEEKIHERDKQIANIHLQRDALAQRLREDYGIELAELEHVPTANELQQREQTEQEIKELREKINGLGAVNLEALDELESLDERFENLSRQFKDLTGAKHSLEQIINRINSDSRKMFAETLDLVKNHFSDLFRRLFGGGSVDIVLDEGVDLLDSGIEFVVRPPGKEPRSISLLSGGERTLTSVALLLAIFRSRPGPVCILDEVDAALDEANIERFVGVLKEFLSTTQFIVVTHSKKTMTVANTLYGVTMEESGVSKRVSVKFEDISEDGQLVVSRELPASQKSGDHEAA